MDYEVAWSGLLEVQGLAKSLSGYQGASALGIPERRAVRDTEPYMLHDADRLVLRRKEYDQRRAEKEREQRLAANQRYRQKHQPKLNAYLKQWRADKRAQQQPLFGDAPA